MYKICAFTSRAQPDDMQIANACMNLLGVPFEIYNVPQHRVEDHIRDNTVVITFGTHATAATKQFLEEKKPTNVRIIELPAFKFLTNKMENKPKRETVYAELINLKEFLGEQRYQPTEITVTDDDLPDLDRHQIEILRKLTEDNNVNSCFQTSKNGRLIEIGKELREDSTADIFVTFEELYTVRTVLDTLGTNEVKLVRNNKTNSERRG